MALVKCSDCGSAVSNDADMCPKCGAPMPHGKWLRSLWWRIPLAIAIIVLGEIVFKAIVK